MNIVDQIQRSIRVPQAPQRIICLVPSLTEYLSDLKLDQEVIGITKFCIKPESWFRSKTRIGGTKTVNLEKIRALKPDLIIANKEENTAAEIEALALEFTCYVSDIVDLDSAFEALLDLARMTRRESTGHSIIHESKEKLADLKNRMQGQSCLYYIWHEPGMLAGGDTFINHLIEHLGLKNIASSSSVRYPLNLSYEKAEPDYVFLSSEPFPFEEKHLKHYRVKYPNARVICVDGEAFSWYGSRLIPSCDYFSKLCDSLTLNCQ